MDLDTEMLGINFESKTIPTVIKAAAMHYPKLVAIEEPERRPLSYENLEEQVGYTARHLRGYRIARNDRVAVILPNGSVMAVAFLGISSCATCAPIDPQIKPGELKSLLIHMKAKALVTIADVDADLINVADELGVKKILLKPDTNQAGRYRFNDEGDNNSVVEYAYPDDIALILHTSGTTALPKRVPLTHANLCQSARNIAESLVLTANDRCLNVMPLFHIHGLIGCLLSNITVGASTICSRGFHDKVFFDHLSTLKPTWYSAVPSMHQAILHNGRGMGAKIEHSLRFVRSCSAALPPQVMEGLEELFGVPVVEAYGMTEASHQIAINPLPPKQRKPKSVGLSSGTDVSVMSDDGTLLPSGELGEIVVKGPTITRGYEENPEANSKAFVDGWFRTGDQGYLDSEGYIFLTDRIKEIINRGGEKISPREVDEVLLSHPSIQQVVTFPIPDDKLGEEVAAAVVVRKNTEVTEWELQRYVSTRLSSFKVPRRLFFVNEIPKGPTGKVQRKIMAQRFNVDKYRVEDVEPVSEYKTPANDLEKGLVEIWSRVLKIKKIGVVDNYFSLGGDSLRAEEIVSEISKIYGISRIPIVIFIHAPTIEKMALLLSKETTGLDSIMVCMQPRGDGAPLFLIHACEGEVLFFKDLVRHLGKERPIYAFRAPFLAGEEIPVNVVQEYASRYIKELSNNRRGHPITLIGAGPGGLIALEMAKQLETPDLKVIMIETQHPTAYSTYIREPQRRVERFIQAIRLKPNHAYAIVRDRRLWRTLQNIVREQTYNITTQRRLIVKLNNAVRNYNPMTYDSPVLLFLSQKGAYYPGEPLPRVKEMSKFLRGRVETHVIQGEHLNILKEPGVQKIAETIRRYINERATQTSHTTIGN